MSDKEPKTFDCPLWPDCDCPDGAVSPDCPALKERKEREDFDEAIDTALMGREG